MQMEYAVLIIVVMIIGKEKDRHLIKLKDSIFINHFKPSLNKKEDNPELVLFTH